MSVTKEARQILTETDKFLDSMDALLFTGSVAMTGATQPTAEHQPSTEPPAPPDFAKHIQPVPLSTFFTKLR